MQKMHTWKFTTFFASISRTKRTRLHWLHSYMNSTSTHLTKICNLHYASTIFFQRNKQMCIACIHLLWMQSRKSQNSYSKTLSLCRTSRVRPSQLILHSFCTSHIIKLSRTDCTIQVGSSTIQPSTVVRDLGLHLDSGQPAVHEAARR